MPEPAAITRAVVFDWGGVLTPPMNVAMGQWLVLDGVDETHFAAVMQEWLGLAADRVTPAVLAGQVSTAAVPAASPVHAIERGQLHPTAFEAAMAEALAARGSVVSPQGLLGRMLAGLDQLDPDMIELIREVRRRGALTGLLSNSWGEHYPEELFDGLFDAVVISGRVGMRKPEPEIFSHVADLLAVPAEQCLFVDDLGVNVSAARAAGMRAVLHTTTGATREAVLAALSAGDT